MLMLLLSFSNTFTVCWWYFKFYLSVTVVCTLLIAVYLPFCWHLYAVLAINDWILFLKIGQHSRKRETDTKCSEHWLFVSQSLTRLLFTYCLSHGHGNHGNTVTMETCRQCPIFHRTSFGGLLTLRYSSAPSNEQLKQVNTLYCVLLRLYCGSLIAEDGECTMEFCTRLDKGQAIGASLQKIWKSHSIPISTKIRLMTALVWLVAMYSCENGTLRKN